MQIRVASFVKVAVQLSAKIVTSFFSKMASGTSSTHAADIFHVSCSAPTLSAVIYCKEIYAFSKYSRVFTLL